MTSWEYLIAVSYLIPTADGEAWISSATINGEAIEFDSAEEMLNFLGARGWELVSTSGEIHTNNHQRGTHTVSLSYHFKQPARED